MKQMSNWLNTNSFKKQDEFYTPKILVEPIIKYLKPKSTVWCPFDTENSGKHFTASRMQLDMAGEQNEI